MRLPPLVKTLADLANSLPYKVDGDSMRPNLDSGHYVLARAVPPGSAPLDRGGIVILRRPIGQRRTYVKRIVGLPNETISWQKGVIYVNGRTLPEPYLDGAGEAAPSFPNEWETGEEEYFAMGDNRASSQDSRTFGPIHRSLILGVVWLRYWPPHFWGRIE